MSGIYNGHEALMAVYQWRMTRRTGHHALDFPYPNCILRCKDGYIFVGSPEGRQWRTLLEVMGGPEWAKEDRFRNRTAMNNEYADAVDGYMDAWLLQPPKEALPALALEHPIPYAPVRALYDVRNAQIFSDQSFVLDLLSSRSDVYGSCFYGLSDCTIHYLYDVWRWVFDVL